MELEVNRRQPQFVRAKERVVYKEKKLDASKKLLSRAENEKETRSKDISHLESEQGKVDGMIEEFYNALQNEGLSREEEKKQLKEYDQLKDQSEKESVQHLLKLDVFHREQKVDQDRVENLSRLCSETERQIDHRKHELEQKESRCHKLTELVGATEEQIKDRKNQEANFETESESLQAAMSNLERKLVETSNKLGQASSDKQSERHQKSKQEVLNTLKQHFKGVHDRISNIIQPANDKYYVAIAKVLGGFMDAIVVDSTRTARYCVGHLEAHKMKPETFLPLPYLRVNS